MTLVRKTRELLKRCGELDTLVAHSEAEVQLFTTYCDSMREELSTRFDPDGVHARRLSDAKAGLDLLSTLRKSTRKELCQCESLLSKQKGPFVCAFTEAQEVLGIKKQAYHSHAYVGNHVNIGVNHYTTLFRVFREFEGYLPLHLIEREQVLYECMRLFPEIRAIYTANRQLSEAEINSLETGTRLFLDTFFKNFGRITPKMHILQHMPAFARQYGSLGAFTEQGFESIHADCNRFLAKRTDLRTHISRIEAALHQNHMRNMLAT